MIQLLGLFLFSFVIFFSILKKDKLNSLSLVTLSIATMLFQGVSPPFGKLYDFLYNNFPGFFIYREVNHFDSLILISFSLLLGSSIDILNSYLERLIKNMRIITIHSSKFLTSFVVLVLIFIYSLPTLSGNLEGFFNPLVIPSYYYEAFNYLEKDNISRIFYPYLEYGGYLTHYKWAPQKPFLSPNVFGIYPYNPSIVNDAQAMAANLPFFARNVILNVSDMLYRFSNYSSKALGLLSVKYIIVDKDDSYSQYNLISGKNIEGIELEKSFGSILIYRVEDYLPLFYASNSFILAKRNESFSKIFERTNLSSPLIIFEDQLSDCITNFSSTSVRINWTFISPVKYKIKVNS
ncbi:MAG: hypothetical protein ACP5PT_08835, partial [Brevinematia bacterium]